MKEKEDYFIILGKKSLAKGGAEKLASGFKLTAKFEIDKEAQKIFKNVPGIIAYRCKLYNDKNEFKGEGGGADTLGRNQNDPNKTIKMAQKRAYVDAVIRTTGLSDVFTQDLEDMPISAQKTTQVPKYDSKTAQNANLGGKKWVTDPNKPASDSQKYKIKKMLEDLGKDMTWLEKKVGKIETMKMGVASQCIEKLQEKIDSIGQENEADQPTEIIHLCEQCNESVEKELADKILGIRKSGMHVKMLCARCVVSSEKK